MHPITRWSRLVAVGSLAGALSACVMYPQSGYHQTDPTYPSNSYPAPSYPMPGDGYNSTYNQPAPYVQQARVLNVETVRVQDGSGVGAGGAIIGGVLGGVLGHQIGGGSGQDLATIAGVVGGALAGHAAQSNLGGGSVRDAYRVSVQMPDGSVRAFDYQYMPDLRPGDVVRVQGNQIYR